MPPEPGYTRFVPNRGMTVDDAMHIFLCVHDKQRVFITTLKPEDIDEDAPADLELEDQKYWIRTFSMYDQNCIPDSAAKILDDHTFQKLVDLFYESDDHQQSEQEPTEENDKDPDNAPGSPPAEQYNTPGSSSNSPPVFPPVGSTLTFEQCMQIWKMMNGNKPQGNNNNTNDDKKYDHLFKKQPCTYVAFSSSSSARRSHGTAALVP